MKTCTRCTLEKENSLFSKKGKGAWCKECTNAWNREYYKSGKDKRSSFSHALRQKRRARQLGYDPTVCEICLVALDSSSKTLAPTWEHNHATKKGRGWTCGNCNTILGMAGENIEILQNAINYLNTKGANVTKFVPSKLLT